MRQILRHVILWQLKDELTEEKKQQVKRDIKQGLEGLNGKISGLESLEVHINGLPASTADCIGETRRSSCAGGLCPL